MSVKLSYPKLGGKAMQANDLVLVEQWRSGSKTAFAEVVEKYQTLVCSIAYANTGNLCVSEELAQETFLSAWRSFNDLRDASRLKQWLCGIARNLAKNSTRKRQRDVLRGADNIEQAHVVDESVEDPSDQSIAREEVELLDRTIQSLPETYREPLVLFYREGESVARVSELLELSPDAVKQRLVRGRKLLHAEVTAVVERGLLISAPSVAFTAGVLAAVSSLAGTAKAATATATAAKGASTMQGSGLLGTVAGGMIGAVAGMFLGIWGAWYGYKTTLKSARSPRERAYHQKYGLFMLGVFVLFAVPVLAAVTVYPNIQESPHALSVIIAVATLTLIPVVAGAGAYNKRRVEMIRQEDGTIGQPVDLKEFPAWMRRFEMPRRYESKARFLGIPLVSIQFNGQTTNGNRRRSAFGWIAMGDVAYGVLFGFGGVAIGAIAMGGVSIGLLSIGGLALGAISLGGVGIGACALGGAAIGWFAFGGLAIGWKAAVGGIAVAREFAVGGPSIANHANGEVAKAFVEQNHFFQFGEVIVGPWTSWVGIAMVFLLVYVLQRMGPSDDDREDAGEA